MVTEKVSKKPPRRLAVCSWGSGLRNSRVLSLSAGVFVLITLPVSAQDVPRATEPLGSKRALEITPTLSIDESYTDNVGLAPAGAERSDWVTRASPAIAISASGARGTFDASFAPQIVYRAREGSSHVFNFLDAKGNAELLEQLLYIDARAAVTQQNISLLAPQAESNVNDTGNRTSVRTYELSPYLRHEFGSAAQGELRFNHRGVSYGANNLYNSDANRVDARLASGPAFKLQTWDLAYSNERINYADSDRHVDFQRVAASARRLFTTDLGLRVTAGYEDNQYPTFGPETKGSFWSVGPEWTPTPRTRLAAAIGRRYFGPTYYLDFSHRSRLTTWRLEYGEDVLTTQGQFMIPSGVRTTGYLDDLLTSAIPDPLARQAAVENYIFQNGMPPSLMVPLNSPTVVPFLQKRWSASFGVHGVRNTVLTNLFSQRREVTVAGQPGAGDFALSPTIEQKGASLLWSLRLTPLTTSNLALNYTRNEFPAISRQDNLKAVSLRFSRQLRPRLSGTLTFRRLQHDSTQSDFGYTENSVSVGLLAGY